MGVFLQPNCGLTGVSRFQVCCTYYKPLFSTILTRVTVFYCNA